MSTDRNLKSRYNMTPDQIKMYKELESTRAIEKYVINHDKSSTAERKVKRQTIDEKYDGKIKKILTPDQYRKMSADKAYREQKAQKNKQNTTNTQ